MSTAYFDCRNGATSEMILAAMIDAGLSARHLATQLKKITLPPTIPPPRKLISLIESSGLAKRIRRISVDAIRALPGQSISLQDVISILKISIGLEHFRFEEVCASPLPLGQPSPVLLRMLRGIPLTPSSAKKEWVTPTALAILKSIVRHFGECPLFKISQVGTAGSLKLLIGEGRPVVMIETVVDDMNPQWYEYLLERLFEAGLVDVTLEPVQMKKNRPGVKVSILGTWDQKEEAIKILFQESTTLGVRYFPVERRIFLREMKEVKTACGKILVKVARDPQWGIEKRIPEYESCKALAKRRKVPLRLIYEEFFRSSG